VVDENVRGVVSLTEDFEMKGMIPTEKVHVDISVDSFMKKKLLCIFFVLKYFEKN
jgi:hypothetical protein